MGVGHILLAGAPHKVEYVRLGQDRSIIQVWQNVKGLIQSPAGRAVMHGHSS